MHKEILTEKQKELLPLVGSFSEKFGLVGGTAIALHIGHRESIDFDLLTLAAMKAYALGRRAKWKDYVDIYFILKNYHTTAEIAERAKEIFSSEFNEKNFRAQLAYFDDIDYTEKVIYHKGFEVDDKVIKDNLIDFSLN